MTWSDDRPAPRVGALLCDAGGTLFASEEPAGAASAVVTNRFLADLGIDQRYEPDELRLLTNGRSFRSTAGLLAQLHDCPLPADVLEEWVGVERDVVTAYLRTVLRPDPEVTEPLAELAEHVPLAVVTSSAAECLDACLDVTGLASFFDLTRRFSAESSLPRPLSKPDPAIHRLACAQLGVDPAETVAIEDSVNGILAAVGAGCVAVGTVQFVPQDERPARAAALRHAGAVAVVPTWWDVVRRLKGPGPGELAGHAAGAGA